MRITEAKLRKLIRHFLYEAPLADFYPPRIAGSRATGGIEPDPEDEYDTVNSGKMVAHKIFATKGFAEKLKKLVANWPVDVWVAPVAVTSEVFSLEDPNDRVSILEPEEILENDELHDPELKGVVSEWMKKSGGNGSLFIPYAKGVVRGLEITPWMIVHAIFNAMPYPGNSGIPALEGGENISIIISKAVELLFEAASVCDIEEKVALQEIEKIFTMGSARNRYFSRITPSFKLNDIHNEAAVQSITTGGFKYDKEALQAFKNNCSTKNAGALIDEAQKLFDQAVTMSPKARNDFMRGIEGKIVIVNVT